MENKLVDFLCSSLREEVSGVSGKIRVHLRVVGLLGDSQFLSRKWGMGSLLCAKVKEEKLAIDL